MKNVHTFCLIQLRHFESECSLKHLHVNKNHCVQQTLKKFSSLDVHNNHRYICTIYIFYLMSFFFCVYICEHTSIYVYAAKAAAASVIELSSFQFDAEISSKGPVEKS